MTTAVANTVIEGLAAYSCGPGRHDFSGNIRIGGLDACERCLKVNDRAECLICDGPAIPRFRRLSDGHIDAVGRICPKCYMNFLAETEIGGWRVVGNV